MRKIASNYIKLPGYNAMKGVYAEIDGESLYRLVPFDGGELQEMEGVEFYGGVLVKGDFSRFLSENVGCDIMAVIDEIYRSDFENRQKAGFYVLSGLEGGTCRITKASKCVKI